MSLLVPALRDAWSPVDSLTLGEKFWSLSGSHTLEEMFVIIFTLAESEYMHMAPITLGLRPSVSGAS